MHGKACQSEQIRVISGASDEKCMKCGRCSASCPSYNEMDVRPHQFVSYLQNGNIDGLLNSSSLWACLSCYACVERCPRDVKPARLIEAARLMVIRRQGENYIGPDEIPELLDPDMPQQLLMSVFRKYTK
ncbi:MAG: 4Fe-4S dicluster domain-containing protein [Defluviitaleaceae bacterium]|nr:4Fe-4S dicluster domain-containing protein [Defluviitaleaceae bacterium]